VISFFFLKGKNVRLRVVFFYLLYSFLSDLIINKLLNKIDPFFGYRMFTIVEFVLISTYFCLLFTSRKVKVAIPVVALLFVSFCVFDLLTSKSSYFDSIPVGLEAILILSYCIFYLFEQMKKADSIFLYSSPDFWIVVSLLIYFAGTFFVFIYAQKYYGNESFFNNYQVINSTFLILKNILLVIAFFMRTKAENYPIIPSKWSYKDQ